jgi:hypothetical protein
LRFFVMSFAGWRDHDLWEDRVRLEI